MAGRLRHLWRGRADPAPPLPCHGLAGRGTPGRSTGRRNAFCPAHGQRPRRGAAVRAPARPVQRTLGRVHGYDLAVVCRRGWGDPGRAGLLERPPPRPDADDRRRGDRCGGPAGLLGDVARQHRPPERAHPRPRERTDSLIRTVVLADTRPFTPLCVQRAGGAETQLFVKEVKTEGQRYIVCRNEADAAKDAADRQAIVVALDQQLKRGDKALIGNSAYRRYLRATAKKAFEIDPGKLADEARYDGVFVLRTNARITPLQAVLRYRDLIQVEQLFRSAKTLMRTRPIYHSSDAAIRGHVFCSWLALILRKELDERCCKAGLRPAWGDVLRDLDRLQDVAISKDGRHITLRTPATGLIGPLFKAAHIALPPNIRDASAA